jgi:hypothetical protein
VDVVELLPESMHSHEVEYEEECVYDEEDEVHGIEASLVGAELVVPVTLLDVEEVH